MQVIEHQLDTDELILSPIGDIQFGSPGCDVEKLKRHVEYGNERGWNYIGMGDYLDPGSPSTRAKIEGAQFYESMSMMIDDGICRMADQLAGILDSPGRWLGLIEGDHRLDLSDGEPIDHYLSQTLKTPFLGTSAFVVVKFPNCPKPLRIWAFHGKVTSGSNPTGLTLDFVRKQAAFEADIYLMGHAHQLYTVRRDVLMAAKIGRKYQVKHRPVIYAATGSFLNGWQEDVESAAGYPRGGYVEQAGLVPVPTGTPVITVRPEKREWGWGFDIRSST